jgi:proteasome lid subunit RPN8/RPN11
MTPTQIHLPRYRYRLELWRPNGPRLLEVPLEAADFAPAADAVFLDALRLGRFAEYLPPARAVRVEPRFLRPGGSPLAAGFRVHLPTPDGGEHARDFGPRVFRSLARRVMVELAREGLLAADAQLAFQLAAYLDEAEPPRPSRIAFTLDAPEPLVPIRAGSKAALGRAQAWDDPGPDDLPVLIPRRVLEDALEEARRFPEREVGGFLLGHLRRDGATAELFLEVTAHLPAEGTEATETSVTFTPQSWAHAREVIRLRGEGEIFAGWVHSHPFRFCAECPETPRPECVGKVLFFSPEDVFLMELAFAQPFMVGLQTAVEPKLERALGHLPVRLYGWRDAEVAPRGFEVFGD